jgi:hypothetical protein
MDDTIIVGDYANLQYRGGLSMNKTIAMNKVVEVLTCPTQSSGLDYLLQLNFFLFRETAVKTYTLLTVSGWPNIVSSISNT